MQEDIKNIVQDGVLAPSGENCQPWRFVVKGDRLGIFNIPEADKSIYNFKQKGSYVAHGALIENISISASWHGYMTDINIFPKNNDLNLVAEIIFTKGSLNKDSLYSFISKRHTNRKEYKPKKISDDQKKELISVAYDTGLGELKILDKEDSLSILGKALAVNEKIIFENKKLHDFFYEHVIWDEKDQEKAGGFYIKTLEFLPHQLKGVKLFKNWFILNLLNKLAKVSDKIATENGEKYKNSAALAIITVGGKENRDYVNAGRIVQRAWLTATKLGISVQPCTGVLYFMENIRGNNGGVFSVEHRSIIELAYKNIIDTFGIKDKTTPMLFRLGYADDPTARSMRMKPNINFET